MKKQLIWCLNKGNLYTIGLVTYHLLQNAELTCMLDPLSYRWGVPPVVIRCVHWTMQSAVLQTWNITQSPTIVMQQYSSLSETGLSWTKFLSIPCLLMSGSPKIVAISFRRLMLTVSNVYNDLHIVIAEAPVIAKSNIILDVKPWDDETDMAELEKCVRSVQKDGLVWGACKCMCTGTLCDLDCFNSLRPSDAIWWHRSGSTLAQVMACCLTAPSHYLNQCWLIMSIKV